MKTIQQALYDYWSENPEQMDEIADAVESGKAMIFGNDTDRIVLRLRLKDGVPYVVVCLGVSVSNNGLDRNTPIIKKMTRDVGGRWAEFYTVRKGFIRIAKRFGFERLPDVDGFMKFKIPV